LQKRCALFCGRGCTGIKLRHSHPGKHATPKQLRAPQSRPSETCIKNLSLASVLSSASTQSCTMARAEAPKTRIFLIPYLVDKTNQTKQKLRSLPAEPYSAWPPLLPRVGCGFCRNVPVSCVRASKS
jgi:hypothetical protein